MKRNSSVLSWPLVLFLLMAGTGLAQKGGPWMGRRPAPAAPAAPSQEEEDRQAIQDLYQSEIRANLALDTDAMANLFDDGIVILAPGHAPMVGRDAAGQYLAQLKSSLADDEILAYTQDWKEVRPLGEYAVEWGTIAGRLRPTAGGDEISYSYDTMRVLKRQPSGAWKIYRWIWNASATAENAPPEAKPLEPVTPPGKEKEGKEKEKE